LLPFVSGAPVSSAPAEGTLANVSIPGLIIYLAFAQAGLFVFVWLPLFALGIVLIRMAAPLSWVVARTQWFLKDGKEHPLKAVGYVAAVIVFVSTAGWQIIFKTQALVGSG